MDFMVLGPVQVVGPTGNRINLASDAQRRLVSHLVLRANTIIRSEELEDHLHLSPGALRTSVSRLRRVLGFDVLVTVAPGYELRTGRVDASRFEELLAIARAAVRRREVRAALEEALRLWRGQAYAEFAHEPWVAAEAQRLEELREAATEELVTCELADGDQASAIGRLDLLIADHPYRDRPRALLMEALAESGRRCDALRAFQDYRQLLLDEVGIEPSSELVALDRTIAGATEPLRPASWRGQTERVSTEVPSLQRASVHTRSDSRFR